MRKTTSRIFIFLGLALCLAVLWITFANLHASPVMLKPSEEAARSVEALMDSLCSADQETMQSLLYGNPDLGLDQQMQSDAGALIYPIYRERLSYEILHAPCVTDRGLAVCVAVTGLDVAELVDMLVETAEGEPEGAEPHEEEAAAPERWATALAQIPEDRYPQKTHTILLNLVHEQGRWWILPEEPLLNVISGTME